MKGYLTQLCIEIVNGNIRGLRYKSLLKRIGIPEGLSKNEVFSSAIHLLYFAYLGIKPPVMEEREEMEARPLLPILSGI
ncbi:MAG: hypothetical protein A3F16_04155 [Deltaproteobacteria bacterium RIFCSPHIGHO2_12_FULL_43_9]|nr:MAG: hypothetical protein A3F16_04155 [Deltaproteobacteria bacterium RIFCSPHIGHO2_12_FULL_43_9]